MIYEILSLTCNEIELFVFVHQINWQTIAVTFSLCVSLSVFDWNIS